MQDHEPRHALVVEDDSYYRRLLEIILRQQGFAVESAETLREAKEWAGQRFDLLTLDLRLPDAAGETALVTLRPLFPFTAIMVISGYVDEKAAFKLLRLGADHCVLKPYSFEEIEREVEQALNQRFRPGLVCSEMEKATRYLA